jgi:hypothetical protein
VAVIAVTETPNTAQNAQASQKSSDPAPAKSTIAQIASSWATPTGAARVTASVALLPMRLGMAF